MTAPLLQIDGLRVRFPGPAASATDVVDGMSFCLHRGEILGLAGESGCGKSMTGLAVLRLVPAPGEIVAGRIRLDGVDLLGVSEAAMRRVRGARIAMVFQDPAASLNPVFTCGSQTAAVVRQHLRVSRKQARQLALAAFSDVGLPEPRRIFGAYPHQLSGGLQQRVMIAMALATGAEVLIADEPTTALDVIVQKHILTLLQQLCRAGRLSVLLICHDLAVVAQVCHRLAVAYQGRVVETGPVRDVLHRPMHPYTRGLLGAVPGFGRRCEPLRAIPAAATVLPRDAEAEGAGGCAFRPRCAEAGGRCRTERPPLAVIAGERGQRRVACHVVRAAGGAP